ncbi:MAG: carbohydrate ABC transporter permease [Flavobacteriaceae bacterium]|nr:carbohydrate ABC transporter permease [Flavobacteriaceae bacterium]
MKLRQNVHKVFDYFVLIFFALLFLYPILWLFINSFKTQSELFTSPWTLPQTLSFVNYVRAFDVGNLGRSFLNSVIISGSVVAATTVLSGMTAYGLTRLGWRWAGLVMSIMLLGLMIPAHATVIPLFMMFNFIKINNTYLAVIIPHVVFTLPVAILIFAGFFISLPKELEEAAIIDGCSVLRAFFSIILPISIPALVTVAVTTFIVAWNDLLFPQIFLNDPNLKPLPVGLTNFQGRYATDYVGMIAAVVVTIVPSIVVYVLLYRRVVSGITAGALKG